MGAATTATPQGSLRQRNVPGASKKNGVGPNGTADIDEVLAKAQIKAGSNGSERDYKITGVIITVLAFLTRFWGINHPNEVVFDEVHFGKVRLLLSRLTNLNPRCLAPMWSVLTVPVTVRIVLPRKDVLFRRPSTLWKTPLRPDGLARRIRRPFPL